MTIRGSCGNHGKALALCSRQSPRRVLRAISINRAAPTVCKIVSAKRDDPAIWMQNVQVALLEAIEIKAPGILKGHAGEAE